MENNSASAPSAPDPSARAARQKKTARVVCAGNSTFWTTQRQFWRWTREGLVTYVSDNPLTGKFEGRRDKLIVKVKNILLDDSAPEHKVEFVISYCLVLL
jgi:hypothetical protein